MNESYGQLVELLMNALQVCAQRNRYDGDYFHDVGLEDRQNASWEAFTQANDALEIAANYGYERWKPE